MKQENQFTWGFLVFQSVILLSNPSPISILSLVDMHPLYFVLIHSWLRRRQVNHRIDWSIFEVGSWGGRGGKKGRCPCPWSNLRISLNLRDAITFCACASGNKDPRWLKRGEETHVGTPSGRIVSWDLSPPVAVRAELGEERDHLENSLNWVSHLNSIAASLFERKKIGARCLVYSHYISGLGWQ